MADNFVSSKSLPDLYLWKRLKGAHIPFSFELEITARCNNNCRHCSINLPAGDMAAKTRELNLDEILSISRSAVSKGALWCLITGGEPLIRDDFPEIYLSLKRLGLLVSVFTNACLIREEHIALFERYPPRDIEVTVYGVTKETYERVTRKPGSYEAFVNGLNMLLESGLKVRLKAMALRSNVHEMSEIARFCRAHTADFFRFDPFLHMRYDGDAESNTEIQKERLSPDEIVALERADGERFSAFEKLCDTMGLHNKGDIDLHYGNDPICNHFLRCGAGVDNFTVSYDGIFRLCSLLWHPDCLYDLRKGSLDDAWHKFVPEVRQMRSKNPYLSERCLNCSLINLCGWCPARAFLESRMEGPGNEYFCKVAHARAEQVVRRKIW